MPRFVRQPPPTWTTCTTHKGREAPHARHSSICVSVSPTWVVFCSSLHHRKHRLAPCLCVGSMACVEHHWLSVNWMDEGWHHHSTLPSIQGVSTTHTIVPRRRRHGHAGARRTKRAIPKGRVWNDPQMCVHFSKRNEGDTRENSAAAYRKRNQEQVPGVLRKERTSTPAELIVGARRSHSASHHRRNAAIQAYLLGTNASTVPSSHNHAKVHPHEGHRKCGRHGKASHVL